LQRLSYAADDILAGNTGPAGSCVIKQRLEFGLTLLPVRLLDCGQGTLLEYRLAPGRNRSQHVARGQGGTGDASLELPSQRGPDGKRAQQDRGLGVVFLEPELKLTHQCANVAMIMQVDDQLTVVR